MRVLESDQSGPIEPSQPSPHLPLAQTVVELDRVNRWNVYRRLHDLGMACECSCDRPLTVAIHTPADALQVWSVVRSTTHPKPALADHLDRCWQHRSL